MANYLIRSCDNIYEYIVDDSLAPGFPANIYFIYFTGESTQNCFSVVSETTDPVTEGVSSLTAYTNCLECIKENDLSIFAVDCNNPEFNGPLSSSYFNEFPIGKFYKFCIPDLENPENTTCFCLEMIEVIPPIAPPFPTEFYGPFLECGCDSEIPRSANTQSLVCEVCCPCESGSTFTVVPPNPVWTDGRGTAVTQLNMIVLGGENGLNN